MMTIIDGQFYADYDCNAFGVVNKSDDCSDCGYNADDCRLLMY